MGIRNRDREVIERLDSKTLDARFTTEIEQGLNCSPFEAEAVLGVVKEVYSPFLCRDAAQPAAGHDHPHGRRRRRTRRQARGPMPRSRPSPSLSIEVTPMTF